ncbi:amidase [Paraburkholderia sp. LEh10]|uniref:amidase n=1 Tax=Paraburkholderia sp. LEh10 TaxID=2821353 RepID=UPI001AE2BC12|nr:amidase [Paraburkholderia sp. LEh10]MBP0595260.1 amidase [Paraburkholderia sp. LEh10]
MKLTEYTSFDGVGLSHLIARGEVSAAEVATAAQRALEAVNPQINAIVETWEPEAATPYVGDAEGDHALRPLAGVPFLLKDLGVTMKGRCCAMGSRFADGLLASADSNLMVRFREAGLVTFGRTTLPELAVSTTTEGRMCGPTRNPWDLERSAGGSSGGAGAAVAAGIVPVAHATDGGGSIRVPASFNGLFGLKPTRGRVSNGPAADEVWNGLGTHMGISRTVRDSAALLDAIQGGSVGEPYYIAAPTNRYVSELQRSPGKLRIGLTLNPANGARTNAAIKAATLRVARELLALGHEVEEITPDLGVSWEAFVYANAQFWTANATSRLDTLAAATGRTVSADVLEPATYAVYEYGRRVSGTDLLAALQTRNAVTRATGQLYQRYDVVLSPTLPELAPRIGEYNRVETSVDGHGWIAHVLDQTPFTALANVTGLPSMTVPLSTDHESGLPIGTQFGAGFGREDVLFRLAAQLEAALPWSGRRPSVWAGASSQD